MSNQARKLVAVLEYVGNYNSLETKSLIPNRKDIHMTSGKVSQMCS